MRNNPAPKGLLEFPALVTNHCVATWTAIVESRDWAVQKDANVWLEKTVKIPQTVHRGQMTLKMRMMMTSCFHPISSIFTYNTAIVMILQRMHTEELL
jgi:hypothetical protein